MAKIIGNELKKKRVGEGKVYKSQPVYLDHQTGVKVLNSVCGLG